MPLLQGQHLAHVWTGSNPDRPKPWHTLQIFLPPAISLLEKAHGALWMRLEGTDRVSRSPARGKLAGGAAHLWSGGHRHGTCEQPAPLNTHAALGHRAI